MTEFGPLGGFFPVLLVAVRADAGSDVAADP